MRKAVLLLLSLLLPLRAAVWQDDACEVNLPGSQGWVPIRVAEVPGTTVLIAMQNPSRQEAFGVNVLNNPPSLDLNDSATKNAIEQLLRGLTYQFVGHSTLQIGATSWLQYPVTSSSGGLNAKGLVRFTSANGRIYAISMLAGGGKDPGVDSEMQTAAASFRIHQAAPIAATKPAPVVAVVKNDKPPVTRTVPTNPTVPPVAETSTATEEESDAPDYKRIGMFAAGGVFVLLIFFRIVSAGSKPKPKPEPKTESKPKSELTPKAEAKKEAKPKAK